MSFDYARSEATARRLLTKFGQPLTFKKDVPPPPPGVPDYGVGQAGETKGVGVLLSYSNQEVDGSLIQSGDAKVLFTPSESVPVIGMNSTINGAKWRVITVEPLAPAGAVVLYTMQVRK